MRPPSRLCSGLLAGAVILILVADVGSVLRHRAGYPVGLFQVLDHSSAEGRAELRALRRVPILDFRAPGTRGRATSEHAAGRGLWSGEQRTEIRRLFDLRGAPGDAVDAYRRRAESDGWRLVETACSFSDRSTGVTLTREVEGRPTVVKALGFLEKGPPDGIDSSLVVTVTGEAPDRPAQGPEGGALRRRDVHCLRAFDPADPSLLPPARQPGSPAEICGLLTLAEAKRVAPAVTEVEPSVNAGLACRYGDVAKGGFVVRAASRPRAYYEDRRSAQDRGADRYIVVDEPTSAGPQGAWVDTRIGPVEIDGGATPARHGLDAGRLVALAELLSRPAAR